LKADLLREIPKELHRLPEGRLIDLWLEIKSQREPIRDAASKAARTLNEEKLKEKSQPTG